MRQLPNFGNIRVGAVVWVSYQNGIFGEGKDRPAILLNRFSPKQWAVMTLSSGTEHMNPLQIVVEPSERNGLKKIGHTGQIAVVETSKITSVVGYIEPRTLFEIMKMR